MIILAHMDRHSESHQLAWKTYEISPWVQGIHRKRVYRKRKHIICEIKSIEYR